MEESQMAAKPNTTASKETALITGASGGIGYEFAKLFAQNGYNLVLVARGEKKLRELAQGLEQAHTISAHVIAKDLTDPASPKELYADLQNASITVDILVNNAGFATYGLFAEIDMDKELQMMQLNMVTLTYLTKLFLRDMLKRQKGKILNVASTAAFQPGPLMAVYYASKAYVLSFSEALSNETQGTGVSVTALCPGPTESGFQARANMEDSKLVSSGSLMNTATVARIGYQALMNQQPVVVPGQMNRLLTLLPKFLPRKLVSQLVRNAQERQGRH
jgi:uncharacterized protein